MKYNVGCWVSVFLTSNVGVSPVLSWPRRCCAVIPTAILEKWRWSWFHVECWTVVQPASSSDVSPCVAGRRWMVVCAQAGLLLMCWSVDDGPINIYIELQEFKHGPGSGFECAVGTNFHWKSWNEEPFNQGWSKGEQGFFWVKGWCNRKWGTKSLEIQS